MGRPTSWKNATRFAAADAMIRRPSIDVMREVLQGIDAAAWYRESNKSATGHERWLPALVAGATDLEPSRINTLSISTIEKLVEAILATIPADSIEAAFFVPRVREALRLSDEPVTYGGLVASSPVKQRGRPPKLGGATVERRMHALASDHGDYINWTAAEWAAKLGCDESAVRATKAWQSILALRSESGERRAASQRARGAIDRADERISIRRSRAVKTRP